MKLKVTKEAKIKAMKALELRKNLPKSKKFGLDKKESNKLGIQSGVERAKQLVRSKNISFKDAKSVCNFKRFLGQKRTQKVQGSIDLWGGEKFIRKACRHIKKFK